MAEPWAGDECDQEFIDVSFYLYHFGYDVCVSPPFSVFSSWTQHMVGAAVGRRTTRPLQMASSLFNKDLATHI